MKKIFAAAAAMVIAVLSCTSVFAAGINSAEQSVLANMRTPANMAGNSVYVPAAYVNQAEAHFNTIDMTDAQAGEINGIISQGRAFLEGTGKSSVKELSASELRTLASYASAAAAVLKLSATVGSDGGQIKVVDKSGNVIVDEAGAVIKTTGAQVSSAPFIICGILAALCAASCAGVISNRKRVIAQYEKA